MDWGTYLSNGAALILALVSLYVARSTRKKNQGDAALAISQAAENIVTMREKEAELKREEIKKLNDRVDLLLEYVEYLHAWIEEHTKGVKKPKSFDEFVKEKTPK